MANWGLMMGIGQGLQQVGGMLETRSKTQLADRLAQEKEARDQARRDKEYERDQLSYDKTSQVQDGEGMVWDVKYAKNGNEMERTIADAGTQKQFAQAEQKAANEAKVAALKITSLEDEVANLGADRALDTRYKEAQIKNLNDRGLAGLLRADGKKSGTDTTPARVPTEGEVANALFKKYASDESAANIPIEQLRDLANKVAINTVRANKQGSRNDPVADMMVAIRKFKTAMKYN